MWTLPPCTCKPDGDPSGCELHDPRSDWNLPTPFYAEGLPCESCGSPTYQARQWNAEHELWIAVDCGCNAPSEPVCPELLPAMLEARTVGELVEVCRQHLRTCQKCGAPAAIPKRKETTAVPIRRKEAA